MIDVRSLRISLLAMAALGAATCGILQAAEPATNRNSARKSAKQYLLDEKILSRQELRQLYRESGQQGVRDLARKQGWQSVRGRSDQRGYRDNVAGDGAREAITVTGINISSNESPVGRIDATPEDGQKIRAFYRKPPGTGPFPAMVFIHGGLVQSKDQNIQSRLMANPTYTRFLAKGYVTVGATFRTFRQDVLSEGPILDCLAIVEEVKQLPFVDEQSVVVFGGSAGGSIAMELAGRTQLAAVVCGEPATVLYTGMLTRAGDIPVVMDNPERFYTPQIKARALEKLKTIACPVLVLHSDVHPLKVVNFEMVLPLMQDAGVRHEIKTYPGNNHGFYWGNKTTPKTIGQMVQEVDAFAAEHIPCKPAGFVDF